ncbi:hypothetical protein [Paenibacillus protaetiae]|uniref:Uncharacterized protein n=1 Tax=Paenibacillus protaetiae TaxID=2509456 RepID=A0A4P6EU54_9BACL|nr:hypothetical protein [Paenibacillus protaetiae]QAY66472.1 hypothetical protein ET464_08670 [Paenibacillus protaetiae]
MRVLVMEKLPSGELRQIDDREWTDAMIGALHHVNYLMVGGVEYETIEGRLNIDSGTMELLAVKVQPR